MDAGAMKLRPWKLVLVSLAGLTALGSYIACQPALPSFADTFDTNRMPAEPRPVAFDPPVLPAETTPEDLRCASPGTVFTLSMRDRNQSPVTWTSLGRQGWDCRLLSSAGGEQGMLGFDSNKAFRLLWPFAVGKTAQSSSQMIDGTIQATTWRITGYQRYHLPLGWVSAFSIDEDITEGDTRRYTVTHYWSPEFGVKIGQRRQAIKGELPELIGPDWKVLAIQGEPRPASPRGAVFPRTFAEEDIRFALKRAEEVHPDLFWNTDRRLVLARAETLIAALPDPASAMDVYLALSEIIGLLGDGHVSLARPRGQSEDVLTEFGKQGGALLLVGVSPAASGLKVVWSLTPGVTAGDVLTTINGQDAKQLFDRVVSLEPGEPELKRYLAQIDFAASLWSLGVQAPFALVGTFAKIHGRIEIPGLSGHSETTYPTTSDEGIRLKQLPDSIALIAFDRMTADRDKFAQRLADIFAQIKHSKAKGLILDLRQNGGGNSQLGDDLLDYISGKPRRAFAREVLRASPECRPYFEEKFAASSINAALKGLPDGTTRTWDVAVATPKANPLRFHGPIAVLIGPGTFSAANILANAMQDFNIGTLVGRDTAEIPNNYAMTCPIRLPRTGIDLRVPSTYFVRANGDAASREDVHPDIRVAETDDDESTNDLDVEAAFRWLHIQASLDLAPGQIRHARLTR